jgi:hypothetical protein
MKMAAVCFRSIERLRRHRAACGSNADRPCSLLYAAGARRHTRLRIAAKAVRARHERRRPYRGRRCRRLSSRGRRPRDPRSARDRRRTRRRACADSDRPHSLGGQQSGRRSAGAVARRHIHGNGTYAGSRGDGLAALSTRCRPNSSLRSATLRCPMAASSERRSPSAKRSSSMVLRAIRPPKRRRRGLPRWRRRVFSISIKSMSALLRSRISKRRSRRQHECVGAI